MSRFLLIFLILTGILMVKTAKADKDGSRIPEELQLQSSKQMQINGRFMVHFLQKTEPSIAHPPESNGASLEKESAKDIDDDKEPSTGAEAPMARKISRHHSSDKSVAGGGVIIGGLLTAISASIYCYIRATRRRDGENIKAQN